MGALGKRKPGLRLVNEVPNIQLEKAYLDRQAKTSKAERGSNLPTEASLFLRVPQDP